MILEQNWRPLNLTCRFTNNEVCALVHFKLAGVFGAVLLTEPLHLFALRAGEACYTDGASKQDGAQVVLNGQVCVPEKTGEESAERFGRETAPCTYWDP